MGRQLAALIIFEKVFQDHGDVSADYVISCCERKQSLADDVSGTTQTLGPVLLRLLKALRKRHRLWRPVCEASQNWRPESEDVLTHVSCCWRNYEGVADGPCKSAREGTACKFTYCSGLDLYSGGDLVRTSARTPLSCQGFFMVFLSLSRIIPG